MTLIKLLINWKDQVKFDQLTKKSFDQTPNLTETFDQLKMSSEIWSSDHSPSDTLYKKKFVLLKTLV